MSQLTSVAHFLDRRGWARFSLVFLLILILKANTLLQPPVWDTAMGLFPPAITLAENGFDLLELLGMPGYQEGAPTWPVRRWSLLPRRWSCGPREGAPKPS